ncbi:MAG: hypothetical protein EAZ97_07285 [Bacteroidetes bacterium]|nr:MAG: hypothetical protein EAZ97_07285 [Bacteroidota bacterium]
MPTVTESGITLNFPDENFFRFENCQGHKNLQNIQEMDCCWYDQNNDILYLIELKGWNSDKLNEEIDPNFDKQEIDKIKAGRKKGHIDSLVKKSVDSLFMFISILLGKPYAKQIQACSPFTISNNTTIKLFTIMDWKETDTTYVSVINDSYRDKFKSYAKLLNIKTYLVMTKTQAQKQFVWVS